MSYEAMVEELRVGLSERDMEACIGQYLGWFQDLHLSIRVGGKRLVSFGRKPVNYADSMVYKPSFYSGDVNGNCFLIRLPSMQVEDGARKFIAKAVRQYKRSGKPFLIIDLRGNGGGADGVYNPLVELAYDHPTVVAGAYFRNTGKNRTFLLEGMKGNKEIVKVIGESADKPDSLVVLRGDYLRSFKKVSAYPLRIAVIIDNQVASNAEGMILALQSVSDRVVLYGREPSLGCADYTNPRPYAIPSCDMVVHIPTTRSGRLPDHPVDPDGIAPEILIPLPLPKVLADNIDTWTRWVAEDLDRLESSRH
jgi:C-terminal processing protease CtpA/Prc